jgi:hypothetical protein
MRSGVLNVPLMKIDYRIVPSACCVSSIIKCAGPIQNLEAAALK